MKISFLTGEKPIEFDAGSVILKIEPGEEASRITLEIDDLIFDSVQRSILEQHNLLYRLFQTRSCPPPDDFMSEIPPDSEESLIELLKEFRNETTEEESEE